MHWMLELNHLASWQFEYMCSNIQYQGARDIKTPYTAEPGEQQEKAHHCLIQQNQSSSIEETIVVAIIVFFIIAPWPGDCTFLKRGGKNMLLRCPAEERGHRKHDTLTLQFFKNWVGYGSAISRFTQTQLTCFEACLPVLAQMIQLIGGLFPTHHADTAWDTRAQVHTIPVFMVGPFMLSITVAWFGDRLQHIYAWSC